MSSTQFRQGYNESKPTSRVLKPPGGGSSNIFGLAPEPSPTPPQPKVNRNESNVFNVSESSPAAKPTEKQNTHSNLFGDVKQDLTPPTSRGQDCNRNPITGLPSGTNRNVIAETQTKGSLQGPIANKGATEANETSQTPEPQPQIRRTRIPSTRVSQPPGGHCHHLW